MKKRALALLLSLVMILNMVPMIGTIVSADSAVSLPCEHHTAHTDACGFVPAVEAQPCTHVCDETCAVQILICTHTHDETCGYAPAYDGAPEAPCTHVHGDLCYTAPTCGHQHDDACGHVEAVAGSPCTFVCDQCGAEEEEEEEEEETPRVELGDVDDVRAELIRRLYRGTGWLVCDFDRYTTTEGRHEGIDFASSANAPIYAVVEGQVIAVSEGVDGGLSKIAVYNAEYDRTMIYLHADPLNSLTPGRQVKVGTLLGYESNRGSSTAHTHLELINGYSEYAKVSVGDSVLDNENPYPMWKAMMAPSDFYLQLSGAQSLDALQQMLNQASVETLLTLAEGEVDMVEEKAVAFHAAAPNAEVYENILDTLNAIRNEKGYSICTCGQTPHTAECPKFIPAEDAEGLAWEGWTPLTSYGAMTTGNYYLTGDLHLSEGNVLSVNDGHKAVLDLNGYAITYDKTAGTVGNRMINIMGTSTLTIQDSRPDTVHYGTVDVKNTKNGAGLWKYDPNIDESNATSSHVLIKGGIITGAQGPWHGGAVYCEGTLIMNGGTIVGCSADYDYETNNLNTKYTVNGNPDKGASNQYYGGGGAVYVKGPNASFTMNDSARIAYCTAAVEGSMGGGSVTVLNGATFTMNSGARIDHSWAVYAGGVFVDGTDTEKYFAHGQLEAHVANGSGSHFYFNGGTIEYCGGYYGGGAYLWYFAHGTMASDATIQYCDTRREGESVGLGGAVGVSISDSNFDLNGGSIIYNSTDGQGGGLDSIGGTININSGLIAHNSAGVKGGAISVSEWTPVKVSGKLNITGGTIRDNSTDGDGGAFYVIGQATMSGGEVYNCTAGNDGGFLYIEKPVEAEDEPFFNLSGGKIYDCKAEHDGGVAYVHQGTVTVSGGEVSNCTAGNNGGVFYVDTGDLTITNGSFTGCSATNGGAAYVSGGDVTMENGTVTGCTAAENGGSFCVVGGTMLMKDGTIMENIAKVGGAAYIAGTADANGNVTKKGNFTITSGILQNNGKIGTTTQGGAVYVDKGDVTVGLEGCTQDNPLAAHVGPKHPVIKDNEASFGGGLAVSGGVLTLYCCNVFDNKSDNSGTGTNIFVEDGDFNQYINGAAIGKEEDDKADHGIVMVGGKMEILGDNGVNYITITYHANGDEYSLTLTWAPEAPEDYWLNLPYCPTEWSDHMGDHGLVFVGWGDHHGGTEAHSIRSIADYKPIGLPVQVKDLKNGEGEVHLYAIWAPVENTISYAASFDTEVLDNTNKRFEGTFQSIDHDDAIFGGQSAPTHYEFSLTTQQVQIPTPSKPGYTFVKWLMYASHSKISNWNADAYKMDENGVLVFDENPTQLSALYNKDMGREDRYAWKGSVQQNFGDIVLVAVFKENPVTIDYRLVNEADQDGCTLAGESHHIGQDTGKYIDPDTGFFVDDEDGKPLTGPEGATVTVQPGRKVVGWFLDADCTKPVPETWVEGNKSEMTIIPERAADGLWKTVTYYALVEYDYGDLIITTEDLPADHSYIFTVTGTPLDGSPFESLVVMINGNGSRTIKNVPVGDYVVKEQSGWTWRYTVNGDAAVTEAVSGGKTPVALFDNFTPDNPYWLDDNAYRKN